jgi:hypothetical protein
MGLFKKNKKAHLEVKIETKLGHTFISDEEQDYIDSGYKYDGIGNYYKPDSVFVRRGGTVYHSQIICKGIIIGENPEAIPESEAVRRGYRRCKICKWNDEPPKAGRKKQSAKVAYRHDNRFDD